MTVLRVFLLLVGGMFLTGFAFIKAWDYGFLQPIEVPPRPPTVPRDAVAIPNIAKTSMYAQCSPVDERPYCEVFAPDGTLIWNERFIADDPAVTISPEQLEIDAIRTQGRDFIALKNGRYLLPSTNDEDHKKVLSEERALIKRYRQ
jgi:hypothetical protein